MCGIYRLRQAPHVPVHEPARCRKCWGTCRTAPLPGKPYCHGCLEAALAAPDPLVVAWASELSVETSGSILTDLEEARRGAQAQD